MNKIVDYRRAWFAGAFLVAGVAVWAEGPAVVPDAVPGTAPSTMPGTASATAPATRPATLPHAGLSAEQAALAEKIDALLPQLADGAFAVRDAATRQLDGLGLAALPILRDRLEDIHDAESKARVGGLIARLEEEAAIAPTLVTLDLKNAGVDDALDALAKAVPFPLDRWPGRPWGDRNEKSSVTLHVENQPFWSVVQKISEQSPMRPMAGHNGLTLSFGEGFPRRACVSGAFVVAATSIDRQYHANLDAEAGAAGLSKNFTISLLYLSDPRVEVLYLPARAVLTTAVDDKGNNLIPEGAVAGGLTTENHWHWCVTNLSVALRYPDRPGDVIKTLKGEMHAVVQTRTAAVEFDDLKAKNMAKNLEGMEVVFGALTSQSGRSFNVEIKLRPGSMTKEAWKSLYDGMKQPVTVSLLDANGNPAAESTGYGGDGQRNQELSYSYSFQVRQESAVDRQGKRVGPPAKVRLEMTTKQREVTIPFEFKDLPMP